MSAAVVRPREDVIEDCLRLWFTIKDTTTVDPAYRIAMATVVDFVTAVEHERCNQIVRAAWGQNVSIDALSQAIDREGGAA